MKRPPHHQEPKEGVVAGEDVEENKALVTTTKEEDPPNPPSESHLRSVLKGTTWRFVASSTTISITYMITGQVKTALEVGVIEIFAKIAIYYIHERIWARIRV